MATGLAAGLSATAILLVTRHEMARYRAEQREVAKHAAAVAALKARLSWDRLWQSYCAHSIDSQGRVIDYSANDGFSTSEGQAYGLFFSLVAQDRALFQQILSWTNQNLAACQLGMQLPAWKWGKRNSGDWGLLHHNSAADADVWLAYTLIAAGQRWQDRGLIELGAKIARRIISTESATGKMGRLLLPGAAYFPRTSPWIINPSYTPLFLSRGLANQTGDAAWHEIADTTPAMIAATAQRGFVPDWAWLPHRPASPPSDLPITGIGSYDAVRVYLWAGMAPPEMQGAQMVLKSLPGMARRLRHGALPPACIDLVSGDETGDGGVGFSGALLPYLDRLGCVEALHGQLVRVDKTIGSDFWLRDRYAYYPANLILFGLDALTGRIRFAADGSLLA